MQQIVDFILELDKLKGVTRKTRPLGLERYENSAEHSWQIALLAASLAHTPRRRSTSTASSACCWCTTSARSTPATRWSTPKGLGGAQGGRARRGDADLRPAARAAGARGSWRCGRSSRTPRPPEARFAHAVDRAMPVLLNLANDGQSWRENGISHERVVGRVGPPIRAGCPALWEYLESRLDEERRNGWFGIDSNP